MAVPRKPKKYFINLLIKMLLDIEIAVVSVDRLLFCESQKTDML